MVNSGVYFFALLLLILQGNLSLASDCASFRFKKNMANSCLVSTTVCQYCVDNIGTDCV